MPGHDLAGINCVENVSHESHYIIFQEEDIELQTPLRLDGIFSYLPTRGLTPEEIENIDNVESMFLNPDSTFWDPYGDAYEDEEDSCLEQKGQIIYTKNNKRELLDDRDVCEITVSADWSDEAID